MWDSLEVWSEKAEQERRERDAKINKALNWIASLFTKLFGKYETKNIK